MRNFTEQRDGMTIEWDAPIVMRDGITLRADIYRPTDDGAYPAILTYGPYGKGLLFKEGYPKHWKMLMDTMPEVLDGISGKYFNWENVDPERWVPWGYVCIRIDSRGACNSEGVLDMLSPTETDDIYECIEWAAAQPWCDGKVAMNGISYFATNQWAVGEKNPPHLAACIMWEGALDYYREYSRSGGMLHDMGKYWATAQVYGMQYGNGDRSFKNRITGENLCGDVTLPSAELAKKRNDFDYYNLEHEMYDEEMQARKPDVTKMKVPLLSTANWGGAPLHPRGNYEGFIDAGSEEKFLEVHGDLHWGHFYSHYGIALQKQFLDYYVKGIENGWKDRPGRVQLQVRHVDKFVERFEDDWPIPRTIWDKWYLKPDSTLVNSEYKADGNISVTYDPKGDGITFLSEPFAEETEFTGPMAAKLFVSSDSVDADIFLVVRLFTPDLEEIVFQGSNDPKTPIAMGWLRASHRRLDAEKTLPYRPYHTHDEKELLTPGEIYELDVEIHPTGIVVPKGYRIGLSVRGRDYVWAGYKNKLDPVYPLRIPLEVGSAIFTHNDPVDRPPEIFGADVTLHFGSDKQPYLLLPKIPEK
jgi:predicted acyl esterase